MRLPLLIACIAPKALALHYYVGPSETKCFIEDLHQDSLIIGNVYGLIETAKGTYLPDPSLQLSISIYESFSNNELVFTQQHVPHGEFTYTAMASGEHRVCITPNFPDPDANLRISVGFITGGIDDINRRRLTDIHHLKGRLHYVINRLEKIKNLQTKVKLDEARHSAFTTATRNKIVFSSIMEVVVLVATCYVQLRYLKGFFIKKKL